MKKLVAPTLRAEGGLGSDEVLKAQVSEYLKDPLG